MAAEHWFRWHHGCVNDPKFRVIASRCVTFVTVGHVVAVWAAMMENASLASPRGTLSGWDDEDVAAGFGFDKEQVTAIREAMQGKVLHGNELASWEKRQPKREDSSAERSKAWRDRNKPQQDQNERIVTHSDANERGVTLETETETDKERDKDKREGSPAGDACKAMREAGCDRVNPSHPELLAALTEGVTPKQLADAVAESIVRGIASPFAYAIKAARSLHAAGASPTPQARASPKTSSLGKTAQAIQALEDMKHGNRLGIGRDFDGNAEAHPALAGKHAGS